MSKLVGMQGKIKLDGATAAYRVITPNLQVANFDSTDSSNYDATTGQLWRDIEVGKRSLDMDLDLIFNSGATETAIIDKIISGATVAFVMYQSQNPDVILFSGNCKITGFNPKWDVNNDTVNGTAHFMSKGLVTRGS